MGGPEKGALVQALTNGGPAEKAGVHRGDIIVKVDGKQISNSRDVQRQVLQRRVGDAVALEIWRDGKMVNLTAKAAELPGDDAPAGAAASEDPAGAKAKLGLSLQTLTPGMAERLGLKAQAGVVITGIKPGSPAAEAGLSRGDVLLEVDRKAVKSAEEASRTLSAARQGGHVLLVQRGDNAMFLLLQPTK